MDSFKALLLVAFAWCFAQSPAHAQYWSLGYSPYTGSAGWQWLARSANLSLNRVSTAATPLYLLTPLVWNASYYAQSGITSSIRRQEQDRFYARDLVRYQQVPNRQPLLAPLVVQPPAPWLSQSDQWSGPVPVPEDRAPDAASDAGWRRQVATPADANATPFRVAGVAPHVVPTMQAPPVAPDFAAAGVPETKAPLAQAFLDLVKDRFKGDIDLAMADKETKRLARSLGLIGELEEDRLRLSHERVDLIRKVIEDDKESALARFQAVRMLLKH